MRVFPSAPVLCVFICRTLEAHGQALNGLRRKLAQFISLGLERLHTRTRAHGASSSAAPARGARAPRSRCRTTACHTLASTFISSSLALASAARSAALAAASSAILCASAACTCRGPVRYGSASRTELTDRSLFSPALHRTLRASASVHRRACLAAREYYTLAARSSSSFCLAETRVAPSTSLPSSPGLVVGTSCAHGLTWVACTRAGERAGRATRCLRSYAQTGRNGPSRVRSPQALHPHLQHQHAYAPL
jgi:hypothetical protein